MNSYRNLCLDQVQYYLTCKGFCSYFIELDTLLVTTSIYNSDSQHIA